MHITWKLAHRLRQKKLRANHFVIQIRYYQKPKQVFEYHVGHSTNRFSDIKPLYIDALSKQQGFIKHIAIIALNPQPHTQHDLLDYDFKNPEHIVDQINKSMGEGTLRSSTHLIHDIKTYVISFQQKFQFYTEKVNS